MQGEAVAAKREELSSVIQHAQHGDDVDLDVIWAQVYIH